MGAPETTAGGWRLMADGWRLMADGWRLGSGRGRGRGCCPRPLTSPAAAGDGLPAASPDYESPRPAGASLPMYSSAKTVDIAVKLGQWMALIPFLSGARASPLTHGLMNWTGVSW